MLLIAILTYTQGKSVNNANLVAKRLYYTRKSADLQHLYKIRLTRLPVNTTITTSIRDVKVIWYLTDSVQDVFSFVIQAASLNNLDF